MVVVGRQERSVPIIHTSHTWGNWPYDCDHHSLQVQNAWNIGANFMLLSITDYLQCLSPMELTFPQDIYTQLRTREHCLKHLSLVAEMDLYTCTAGLVPRSVSSSLHCTMLINGQGCYIYVVQERAHSNTIQNIIYGPHYKHIASISKTSLQIWSITDGSE